MKEVKPIIRYVGSKQWFVKEHSNLLPNRVNSYYEPFLGSASVYLKLKSLKVIKNQSHLSDINNCLINLYTTIKKEPSEFLKRLSNLEQSKEEYYKIRSEFNLSKKNQDIYFYYLNRMSFGGIFRLNKSGEFNVPYGNRTYKKIIDSTNLKLFSEQINEKTKIKISDFKKINFSLKLDDFICLDPPYLDNTSKFNRYNSKPFQKVDTNYVSEIVQQSHMNKSKFLLFVGDNLEYAKSLSEFGKVIKLTRKNNLSIYDKSKIRVEYIVKNY